MNFAPSTPVSSRRARAENLEFVALAIFAFILPLMLRHPQALVGTAVNTALILGALHLRSWGKLLPLIVLPSVGAIAGGMLFGPDVTLGLALLAPVIWAGNGALVVVLRRLEDRRYPAALLAAAAAKTLLIGGGAVALVAAGLLPAALAGVMAPLQFATVLAGGLLAWPLAHLITKTFSTDR
ncbi:hypothetical protein KQI84_05400 [bacterium]|nr:hypothetical protein [bacterium]